MDINLTLAQNIETYTSKQFTIRYPTNWEISPKNLTFPYYGTATVISFRPISNSEDLTDHPALSITLTDVEKVFDRTDMKVKPKTLEQIANDTIIFYKNPGPLGDTQFKLLKNTTLTVGGQPGRQIQYITQSLGLFAMETYVIKDGKLYTISFSAPELRIPEMLSVAKNITQSFQFTG
jgi:photosystem II reaction center protein PsbP